MEFQLELDERGADRVFVVVRLAPTDSAVIVERVHVAIVDRRGAPISPKLLVPISGPIAQPVALMTELRSTSDIPRGSRVIGTVWTDRGSVEASCPAEPGTSLLAFAEGGRIRLRPGEGGIAWLSETETLQLKKHYSWIDGFRFTEEEPEGPVDSVLAEPDEDMISTVAEEFDLSDDDMELLKELLSDDDPLF